MSQEDRHCPHCGAGIKLEHRFCTRCGGALGGGSPLAPRRAAVTPEQAEKTKKNSPLVWAVVLILIVAPLYWGMNHTDDMRAFARRLGETSAQHSPSANPGLALPAPAYEEIRLTVQSMTEAQWKQYLGGLRGYYAVNWTGWVVDVDRKLSGDYVLWVDMDAPGAMFSVQDVYIPVPDRLALALHKDQEVVFSGMIRSANNILGSLAINLENATVEGR